MNTLLRRVLPAALCALAACGDGPTKTTPVEPNPIEPAPSEPRILLTRYNGSTAHLFSVKLDGSDPVQITRTGANECGRWSPDRRRVAVVGYRTTRSESGVVETTRDVYVMNADGSDERQITTGARGYACLDWSPDGRKIVYSAAYQSATNLLSLYIVDADGANPIRLTRDISGPTALPRWSPDGRSIVYIAGNQLRVIGADGSGERVVNTACTGTRWAPAWSPDGGRIAYECEGSSRSWQVHTIRADGTGDVTVSPAATPGVTGGDASPIWSPDGQKLAISRITPDSYRLFIVSADGTNPVLVTRGLFDEIPNDWR